MTAMNHTSNNNNNEDHHSNESPSSEMKHKNKSRQDGYSCTSTGTHEVAAKKSELRTTRPSDREAQEEEEEDDDDTVAQDLMNWIRESGGTFPKIEIQQYTTEVRGVHATSTCVPQEQLVAIPLECLITVEMGQVDTEMGRKISSMRDQVSFAAPKHMYLMMFLLEDMKFNPTSRFQPYYRSLPKTLRNMPIFWSQDELEWLRGSPLYEQILDRQESIAQDYARVCAQVDPAFSSWCSLAEFQWARMIVCSRNFGIQVNGLKTAALVPLADMLNHFRPRETSWRYDDIQQSFTITSLTRLEAGVQIYDSYGRKCNHRFLLNYGFALADNVEHDVDGDHHNPNEILMTFTPPPRYEIGEGSMSSRLQLVAKSLGLELQNPTRIRMSCRYTDANVQEGMSIARLLVATSEELDDIIRKKAQVRHHPTSTSPRWMIPPVSLDNEARMVTYLGELMQAQLGQYPTTVDQDRDRIPLCMEFSNEKHARVYLVGEKQVCQYYLELAQHVNRLVMSLDDDDVGFPTSSLEAFEHLMQQQYLDHEMEHCRYIQNVIVHLVQLEKGGGADR